MATRRRGGADLDDLKAMLGYSTEPGAGDGADSGATAREPSDADAAPVDVASADTAPPAPPSGGTATMGTTPAPDFAPRPTAPPAAPAAAAPRPAAPATPPAPAAKPAAKPAAARSAADDYAGLVREEERPDSYRLDPDATDPSLGNQGGSRVGGLILVGVLALAFGATVGVLFTQANDGRKLINATQAEAALVHTEVKKVADGISGLQAALADIDAEAGYRPEFQDAIRQFGGDKRPILNAGTLAGATKFMAYEASTASDVVDYSVRTNVLSLLLDQHLARTERDQEEIARITANTSDTTKYGIAFDFQKLVADYNNYTTNPAAVVFAPVGGERVSYDVLAIQTEGVAPNQRFFYNAKNSVGAPIQVNIFDLVTVENAQLLPAVTRENAVDRYRVRAFQIKETIDALIELQPRVLDRVANVAARPELKSIGN